MPVSASESIRDRFERAIEDTTDGIHDATQWWDAYNADDNGQRPIDRLLDTLTDIAKANRKEQEQAVLSAASSIIDCWDDWDAEAQQAAHQDQDDRSYRHVMLTHIVCRLWREFGWPMH